MKLGRQFTALTAHLGLILTLYECSYANEKSKRFHLGLPSARLTNIERSYDLDHAAPPSDESLTNYNLTRLVNYILSSPAVSRKQEFNSLEKTGQAFRSSNADVKRGRHTFVTVRIPTPKQNKKDNGRNLRSHDRRNAKDNHGADLRYNLYERPSDELVKQSIRKSNDSAFGNANISNENGLNGDKKKVLRRKKTSLVNGKLTNGVFSQANLINTDIKYQMESTEFVSRYTAEPTKYVYSSQRNGFVPVSGPFGNSGYYEQNRNYRRRQHTSVNYTPESYASQPRAETRSFYSSGKDLLGSGNFEILRGGTFSDNDDPIYSQQQHNDMLFEQEVPYSNPILGFQGFNHFSSPLHSSLSEVIHVAARPRKGKPSRESNFVSTTAVLEAVP